MHMELQQTYKKFLVGIGLLLAVPSLVWAEKLEDVVKETVPTNPEILRHSAQRFASNSNLRESISGYFPSVDLSASFGRDHNENYFSRLSEPVNGDLTLTRREAGMSIKQMLFDGFAVRSTVEADTARVQSATFNVLATLEDVILDLSGSYIDNIMLRSVFMHAKDNMLYLQDLVDQMVRDNISNIKDGDLDLAKSRLSRAHTSMLDVQRQVRDVQADYIKVVGKKPGVMYRPESPENMLPTGEEAAVAVALNNHPRVYQANAEIRAARADKCYAKSNYFPRLELEIAGTSNKNVDGYNQSTNSLSAMLQMRYNLFRGGADVAKEQKAGWMIEASKETLSETMRLVEQHMRHTWSGYVNYKGKLVFLKDRVDTLQKTRDVYYKEYADGKRDILDLLDAADELYLAKVEFLRAQYKELLSRFMILHGMGKIHAYFKVSTPAAQPCAPSKWFAGY